MTILRRVGAALAGLLVAAAGSLTPASAVDGEQIEGSTATLTPDDRTQLVYEGCYEHLGRFAVPIGAIGIGLPDGFGYLPDGAGGVFVNVVGLDCRLGGERVVDVFIAAPVTTPPGFTPPEARASLLLVRRYTSRPDSAARFAQWCFGNVAHIGDVDAHVVIAPDGSRTGSVSVVDGSRSIELTTTVVGARDESPATIQHFTVTGNQIGGRLTFTAGPGTRAPVGGATLVLDGAMFSGLGAHVYGRSDPGSDPFDFTYSALTCPPGLIDQAAA